MRIADTEIKEIIKLLERLGYSMGVETVFRDWCECFALALSNGCDLLHGAVWEKREKRYLDIIGKYKEPALLCGNPEPQMDDMTSIVKENPWLE